MTIDITNNTAQSRFELIEQGHTAYADYRQDENTLSIKYVFAPEALRGQGTAGRLMEGIASLARARNLKILPICGYAASWLRRHQEHHDLVV
jgi:predicted GNAT family acetyltransferase